jgi:hypothetical protein
MESAQNSGDWKIAFFFQYTCFCVCRVCVCVCVTLHIVKWCMLMESEEHATNECSKKIRPRFPLNNN